MLDLSPEKVMVLLSVGLVVLGPDRLPAAARSLAHGLGRARRLAAALTNPITTTLADPVRDSLAEPRQAMEDAVADLRSAVGGTPAPADPSLN